VRNSPTSSCCGFKDCLVTLIDLVDTKKLATSTKGIASSRMRKLHSIADKFMSSEAPKHDHAYAWNDSVLLLAFLDGERGAARIALEEADQLKKRIDKTLGCNSYAVCVRGQTFPLQDDKQSSGALSGRCTILRSSSFAMANCYIIESELKQHRADWYIQNRLKGSVAIQPFKICVVDLLPYARANKIMLFKDPLF